MTPRRARSPRWQGMAARIALVAFASAAVGVSILAAGVWLVGGKTFTDLMVAAGDEADHAREMFDASVTWVLLLTLIVAALASLVMAVVLARWLARPIAATSRAAHRIAAGDYAARVPPSGPGELADLAKSFNLMAASLEEQERLRRELVANAAHELRTPLTNIGGYLEALRDGVVVADRSTYESLWEEAQRLVRLAHSLEDLSEADRAGHARPRVMVDLSAQLEAALELARPGFDARAITVERRWPEGALVRADPDHLKQVLANLLNNAVRYTPTGGRVTVEAVARAADVTVSVENDGDGIPAADLPRVFERFYRVEKSRDRAQGGAGIGLAIVKELVEAAGGRVGAESAAGHTRFWFSLPSG
jgi:two-component system sensor histidine kinase BaeS